MVSHKRKGLTRETAECFAHKRNSKHCFRANFAFNVGEVISASCGGCQLDPWRRENEGSTETPKSDLKKGEEVGWSRDGPEKQWNCQFVAKAMMNLCLLMMPRLPDETSTSQPSHLMLMPQQHNFYLPSGASRFELMYC